MKKYAVALFAGLLILAIAAPLFAETYIDGLVFYRPRIYYNTDFLDDNAATNDARILPILWVGAGYKAEDYAEGYFRLGTLGGGYALGGADYSGEAPNGDNTHPVSLQQVWFDVKVPGTPVHYRLGRFAQSLGHGFVMNTGAYGGDGMKFYAPIGPAKVELGYMKYNEQGDLANDIDQYFLQATAPLAEKHQLGAYFQWFEGRNMNIGANTPSSSKGSAVTHMFTMWDPSIWFDSHIWSLGVSADGAIDMISYRAEAAYVGGKILDNFKKTDTFKEEKLSGFALMAGATANLGPATVSLEGAYGSGDKREKISKENLGSGTKYEGFKVPMAQWGRTVFYDEWSFFHQRGGGDPFDFADGFGGGVTNNHEKRTAVWVQRGLENQIYLTIGATYTPITPVTLGVDIFKFWAAETTPKQGFDPDSRIIYKSEQDNDVGWEIDLTAKWTLNKNFSVTGAFAPFIPGDYFKVPKGSRYVGDVTAYDSSDPSTYEVVSKDSDPEWGYVLRANCIFSF